MSTLKGVSRALVWSERENTFMKRAVPIEALVLYVYYTSSQNKNVKVDNAVCWPIAAVMLCILWNGRLLHFSGLLGHSHVISEYWKYWSFVCVCHYTCFGTETCFFFLSFYNESFTHKSASSALTSQIFEGSRQMNKYWCCLENLLKFRDSCYQIYFLKWTTLQQ